MSPGMPLESLHLLLTYRCIYQCDHCFLHCGPLQPGTFTMYELDGILEQAAALEGLGTVYFEGGEPMLYYPLLLHGIRRATELGLGTGIVTCGYYATSQQDGRLWIEPLKEAGLTLIDVSLDELHGSDEAYTHARNLIDTAKGLGLGVNIISVSDPRKCADDATCTARGEDPQPSFLRGRAAHELVDGLDLHPVSTFGECTVEDLEAPTRVHMDPFGNIHVCQGIIAGNVWESSLASVVRGYDPHTHPVIGPLVEGGPARLAEVMGVCTGDSFATDCHACYEIRRAVRTEHKRWLGPAQVYGDEPDPPPDTYD
jgi:hypothetical protein